MKKSSYKRSPDCCFKGCTEPKHPGRQCCTGHLPLYDRMREELKLPVQSAVVRRDRVTPYDDDDSTVTSPTRRR